MDEAALNALSKQVLDAAFTVHTALGPGLLESAYEACLASELVHLQVPFQQQVPMPLIYRGEKLSDVGYRLDLLVAGELILEIKAVDAISPVHHAQLLSYLRLSQKRLGCSSTSMSPVCETAFIARSTGYKSVRKVHEVFAKYAARSA